MNELWRIKYAIKHLISNGIAHSQKELGIIMGYSNESSFSQVLNGKVDLPKNFIEKLISLDNCLNPDWIRTGNGEMLLPSPDAVSERRFDYNPQGTSRQSTQQKNVNIIEPGDIASVYKALLEEKDRRIEDLINSRDNLCLEKDCRIRELESRLKEKDETIRLLKLEQPTAQSSTDVSDAAAG